MQININAYVTTQEACNADGSVKYCAQQTYCIGRESSSSGPSDVRFEPLSCLRLSEYLRHRRLRCSTLELSRRRFSLEHDIQLGISHVFGLRQAEVSPEDAQRCHARPEEASFGSPVPSRRVAADREYLRLAFKMGIPLTACTGSRHLSRCT